MEQIIPPAPPLPGVPFLGWQDAPLAIYQPIKKEMDKRFHGLYREYMSNADPEVIENLDQEIESLWKEFYEVEYINKVFAAL